MKSYCIKTNNKEIIKYLLNKLEKIEFPNIYYSEKLFKKYINFIMHYTDEDIERFNNIVINIISEIISKFYEERIIKRIINVNYFYFETNEKNIIFENCKGFIYEKWIEIYEALFKDIDKYLKSNSRIYLEGIVNFRINSYVKKIDNIVDMGVNQYIIEKEYKEFISLLKIYVNSTNNKADTIHLVYVNGESILLDKDKKVIELNSNLDTVQYLSDITFSSNDIALNMILNILPSRIDVHVIDKEDEFINTILLIFEDRVRICTDCNICRTYKKINEAKFSTT